MNFSNIQHSKQVNMSFNDNKDIIVVDKKAKRSNIVINKNKKQTQKIQ